MFNMMMYTNDPLNNSICQQQPLHRLVHSKGCSLILSASLLGIGITITVMSLRSFSSTNKIFLVGPILMTVGILGMSRFLMQYLKKANSQRHQRARRRSNQPRTPHSWQNPCVHLHTDVPGPRADNLQTLHIPTLCHGVGQREDSESAIYLGPTDSEEGAYSDDPPPYDSVAVNTGTMVTSRVQIDNAISSSLPSLPPYDEGLVNPALDLSTETFPAPPPYEMVAVQPPSYSTGADVIERPVRAVRQNVHGLKRKTLDPTRHTVHEVAQRLVESIQAEQALRTQSETQQEANELTDIAIPGLAMQSFAQHEDVHMADGHNSCSRSVVFADAEVLQTTNCSQMPTVSELLQNQESMPCHRNSYIDPGTPEVIHDPVEEADLSGQGSDLVVMEDVPSSSNKVGIHDLVDQCTASSENCVIHSIPEESSGPSTDQIINNDCSSPEVLSVMGESFINCQEEEQNICPGVHLINTKERSHCIHHADTAAAGGLDPEGGTLEPDSAHAMSTNDIVKEECTDLEAVQSVSSVEQTSST